jgi:hypothetical protein
MTLEQSGPQNQLPQWVEDLLHSKQTLVLATCKDNLPYCSLMCFTPIAAERSILLVTARESAKFSNMQANEEVSLLLADEISFASGRPTGKVVTFLGRASEVGPEERPHLESLFAGRFPGLASFAQSGGSALVRVRLTAAITSGDVSQATHYSLP